MNTGRTLFGRHVLARGYRAPVLRAYRGPWFRRWVDWLETPVIDASGMTREQFVAYLVSRPLSP
jgi:hypothetical protein